MHLLLTIFAFALLTAEFLWPAEDAVNGGGLHLIVLWLVLATLQAIFCWLERSDKGRRFSRPAAFTLIDAGMLLIAAGHVLSTAVVFQAEGDRRAALNLTLEWSGLFFIWRLFRSRCMEPFFAAQTLQVVIAVAVSLSAFGIWQHHVFYPEQAAWYRGQRAELDESLGQSDGRGVLRAAELVSQLQEQGIPVEGTDRILWENRLLSSSEPFATFSLANTLAGVLATALVLLIGQTTVQWKSGEIRTVFRMALSVLQICLITYCLVLTKSRSAWLGAAAGLLILSVVRSRTTTARKMLQWGMGGCICAMILAGAAALGGALDKEVILESPRSFQFRLLYWTGALEMLKDHPVTGAGPGNFRQLYLKYKADESSEEIRDPHNFVLEAWSAGGVTSLVGLLLFVGCVLKGLAREYANNTGDLRSPLLSGRNPRKIVPCGLALGFLIQEIWLWINGESLLTQTPMHAVLLTGLVVALLQAGIRPVAVDRVSCFAAAVVMMVNLLAAGGFEMPAVVLLLLVCAVVVASRPSDVSEPAAVSTGMQRLRFEKFASAVGAVACVCLAGIVLKWGLLPVLAAQRNVAEADNLMHRQRNLRAAIIHYQKAITADPFAVVPCQRVAELELSRLRDLKHAQEASPDRATVKIAAGTDSGPDAKKSVSQALDACDVLIAADRRNSFGFRARAECLALGARLLNSEEMMQQAIDQQQQVVEMYPSSVDDWVQLVRLYETDPRQRWKMLAETAAVRCLQLEEINRRWGHQDRYLAESDVLMLKSLSNGARR